MRFLFCVSVGVCPARTDLIDFHTVCTSDILCDRVSRRSVKNRNTILVLFNILLSWKVSDGSLFVTQSGGATFIARSRS